MAKLLDVGDLVQRVRTYNTFDDDGWIEVTDKLILGIVVDVEYAEPSFGQSEVTRNAFIKVAWQDQTYGTVWCFIEELRLYKKFNK